MGNGSIWRSLLKVLNQPNVSVSKAKQVLSFQVMMGNVKSISGFGLTAENCVRLLRAGR